MDVPVRFIDSIINNPLLMQFLVHRWFFLLEYDPRLDQLRVYDTRSRTLETLDAYLGSEKPEHATIFAEDRWKMRTLLTGELYGPLEMRFVSPEGVYYSREVDARPVEDPARGTLYVGYAKDITDQKNQTQELLEQAHHDSLTQLYNNRTGKELIDRYLQAKDPYASCGMLVIDLDFFKNVNDCYGHLFGDKVLQEFARLLRTLFRSSDILVRFGGDEFVIVQNHATWSQLEQMNIQLQSMLDVYDRYGNRKIYDYALAYADTMINADGTIKMYKREEYSLDRINSGKFIFRIYEQAKDEKYKKALALMRSQLDEHPRNADGGFWHKKIYPNQVWLDGIYMGAPFYAEYAFRNNQVKDYADVINQFLMAARHTYDAKNDLYRHACDVSRKERWADLVTGQSKHSWGRAMGWYAMAFVDALDFIPEHESGRDSMLVIFNKIAAQIKRLQDSKSGLWYQVLDKSGAPGNYLESSCSTMFVYSLFKGVRKGYIDKSYLAVAIKGYKGILDNFIEVDGNGVISITKACAVAGLGGKVYRSGDYDYYINETVRDNDPKAVGPFILASLEWERLQDVKATVNQK